MIKKNRNVIAKSYKILTPKAKKLTKDYERVFGFPCDVYFPVHNPQKGVTYQRINIFEGNQLPHYMMEPDLKDISFVIPGLMRKESMNSVADEFDNFILKNDKGSTLPFIETSPDNELPQYSKVVVKIGSSVKRFFIDKKTVVNGAGGHMLMRMWLNPLTEDSGAGEEGNCDCI